jgi:hypothetical protein
MAADSSTDGPDPSTGSTGTAQIGGTGNDSQPASIKQNKVAGVSDKAAAGKMAEPGLIAGIFRRRGRSSTSGADECLPYEALTALRVRVRSKDDVTDEVAEELSAALRQAERIRAQNLYIPDAADQLTFIVDCLLAPKPQLILARDERLNLQVEIYRQAGCISRTLASISSGSPVGLVLSALLISFFLWSMFMLALQFLSKVKFLAINIFFMDGQALGIITSAALIGGIVSIATRLNEFSRVRDLDPFAMFWTAMLKPLIGVVLSVFILATLEGHVLSFGFLPQDAFNTLPNTLPNPKPDPDKANQTKYILWMLGFLAGFSERFAWDFVGRAQGVASGPPSGDTK